MAAPLLKLLYAMYGLYEGRDCRSCGEAISPEDGFGMSEGVCGACRSAA